MQAILISSKMILIIVKCIKVYLFNLNLDKLKTNKIKKYIDDKLKPYNSE